MCERKRVILFGTCAELACYMDDLYQKYKVVAITDDEQISGENREELFVFPKDIESVEFDYLIIVDVENAVKIRRELSLYTSIDETKIINIDQIILELEEMHLLRIEESLQEKRNNDDSALIYAFGDSHVSFFGEASFDKGLYYRVFDGPHRIEYIEPDIKPFMPFHLGGGLAYNLCNYETTTQAREKAEYLLNYWIPLHARLLFAFGEIDLRVHVLRQVEHTGKTLLAVITEIIDNYLAFLVPLRETHEIIVWGPVASQPDNVVIDPRYPRYGNMVSRNCATMLFNRILEKKCRQYGLTFISVFPYLIDKNMETRTEFYMDAVHIRRMCWAFARVEFERNGIYVSV